MKISLFYDRSVHENAAYYYQLAKEAREKLKGVKEAIAETEKELKETEKKSKKEVRIKRQKEWFEKYHNATTGNGLLIIGGRNAQQNDQLVSKHMEQDDLFFHADIQGGTVVVLKGGVGATDADLTEAAQFAACFSNAWKNANASVDVYAVKKDQLTKKVSGGFIPTGAFAILGERKWFRDTKLVLRLGINPLDSRVHLVPDSSKTKLNDEFVLVPSLAGKDKGAIAKSLSKRFKIHPDELLEILPNGKSKTIQK